MNPKSVWKDIWSEAVNLALAECKAKHGGCENCEVNCMWREVQRERKVDE